METVPTHDDAGIGRSGDDHDHLVDATMDVLRDIAETEPTLINIVLARLAEQAPEIVDAVIADVEAGERRIAAARQARAAD